MGKYLIKIFLNNIFFDNSYDDSRREAQEWKEEFEDDSISIWDRINGESLKGFARKYQIENVESITVSAEIVC